MCVPGDKRDASQYWCHLAICSMWQDSATRNRHIDECWTRKEMLGSTVEDNKANMLKWQQFGSAVNMFFMKVGWKAITRRFKSVADAWVESVSNTIPCG